MNVFDFVNKQGIAKVINLVTSTTEQYDFQSTNVEPVLAKDGSVVSLDVKQYTIKYSEVVRVVESYHIVVFCYGTIDKAKEVYAHMEGNSEWCRLGEAIGHCLLLNEVV